MAKKARELGWLDLSHLSVGLGLCLLLAHLHHLVHHQTLLFRVTTEKAPKASPEKIIYLFFFICTL